MVYSHQIKRFKERYGRVITEAQMQKLNVDAMSSPQLKYTNVRKIRFEDIDVYVYIKCNKITTFLTRDQAINTQYRDEPKYDTTPRVAGIFSIGDLIKI